MTPERLAAYRRLLSDEGKVMRWPKKDHEKRFVLEYLFGDHALLRCEMFDRHLLNRTADGKEYWI